MEYRFESLCGQLLDEAKSCRQRRLLVLAGDRQWGRQQVAILQQLMMEREPLLAPCWVSDKGAGWPSERVIPVNKHQALLGSEFQLLIFDACSGMNADALGAASGVVVGGGLMVLLIPPLDQWAAYADPEYERLAVWPTDASQMRGNFLHWMTRQIRDNENLVLIEESAALPVLEGARFEPRESEQIPPHTGDCLTEDQQVAMEAVRHVALGHRRRPLVLTADRGRGKSSALGIAAASLLREGAQRILVTAPNLNATEALFQQAGRLLKDADIGRGCVSLGAGSIEFIAPDELLKLSPECDLLLVDEAAAIPAPLLESMLTRYARIVYATTIHGYEGSGRGFTLRFKSVLQQITPQWRQLQLNEPIRWAAGDPLERWCFNTLLLDAECSLLDSPEEAGLAKELQDTRLLWMQQHELLEQPQLLSQLFGLLVIAHYRTSPADLRHLFDGPNLSILLLMRQQQLLGVVLAAAEGGFDPVLSQSVWLGKRRPRGHLLPQSLAAHAGFLEAPQQRCLRVMRIAVHPQVQGRGYGLQLVSEVERNAGEQGFDSVGASFGATSSLLKFWHRAGWLPVRLGVSREASSGSYSAMVLKAISSSGEELSTCIKERFAQHFPQQLAEVYPHLDTSLLSRLLEYSRQGYDADPAGAESKEDPVKPRKIVHGTSALQRQDWLDLISFADGYRVYETCTPVLRTALLSWLHNDEIELRSNEERILLLGKVLQQCSWPELARTLSITGRQQLLKQLRALYARQLDRCLPKELQAFRDALREGQA